jgi:hypothetical protein
MTVPYSLISFCWEILEIFYSKATVASPMPNFLEEKLRNIYERASLDNIWKKIYKLNNFLLNTHFRIH